MSVLTIKAEVLGGTSLERAILQAKDIRRNIGANIEFDFNGVKIFICRDNQNIVDLVAQYEAAVKYGGNQVIG